MTDRSIAEQVPAELRELRRWVVWRYDQVRPGTTTKVPYQAERPGVRAKSNDPATWASYEAARRVAKAGNFEGVGVCLGDLDDGRRLAGIDLDDCIADGVLAQSADAIVVQVDTYWEISPSGTGLKGYLFGRKPEGAKCAAPGEWGGQVEVYDSGRWFAVTGQCWGGSAVRPAQAALAEVCDGCGLTRPDPPAVHTPLALPRQHDGVVLARASAYLATLPPAIRGAGGHSALYAAATALAHGFELSRSEAIAMLAAEYNPRCIPSWDMTDRAERRDFERKVDQALSGNHREPRGYLLERDGCGVVANASIDTKSLIQNAKHKHHHEEHGNQPVLNVEPQGPPIPIPAPLLEPPGLLGRIAGWINATASQHQPELALGNAIAFAGALVGRKVRSESDARTNFYCLGLGESCCGKNHSREQISRLAMRAGADRLMAGEDVSSDAALMRIASETPALLLQLDEIGHFLSAKGSAVASTYERAIVPTLTKLFTSSNGVMRGKEYADGDKRERKDIIEPNVCLYGTATPGQLFSSISLSQITDGFMGRLLVFASSDFDPEWCKVHDKEPGQDLVSLVKAWCEWSPPAKDGVGNVEAVMPGPMTAKASEEAEAVLDEFRSYARQQRRRLKDEGGLHPLWGRASEQAVKLALLASLEGPRADVVITPEAARWACELVDALIVGLIAVADRHVADSERERVVKKMLNFIRSKGAAGATRSEVARRFRGINARTRDEIAGDLMADGDINLGERHVSGQPGRPAIVYKA